MNIQIHEARRKRQTVAITYMQGANKFTLEQCDNPLPSFGAAFDALLPLVGTILHLPTEWLINCRVVGIKIKEISGASTVSLLCTKGLDDAAREFAFTSPPRLLAHPVEPGSYTPPLLLADVDLVAAVIEECKKYVRGERAQGVIVFADETGADDGSGTEPNDPNQVTIEITAGTSFATKRKRGRPRKEAL